MKGKLFMISGPSGVGKGTLRDLVYDDFDNLFYSISMTTRNIREGEEHGREYYFSSKEEFKDLIKSNGFLEYAEYVGNYYGTPQKFIEDMLENGKNVLLEIEPDGALQVMKKIPEVVSIFILPPSILELKNRLINRGTETEDSIENRIETAKKEIKFKDKYKYQIINANLKDAKNELKDIIEQEMN